MRIECQVFSYHRVAEAMIVCAKRDALRPSTEWRRCLSVGTMMPHGLSGHPRRVGKRAAGHRKAEPVLLAPRWAF